MTRVFQLTDSSEGYLARLYRFLWPHVIGCLQSPNLRGRRLTKGKFLWEVGNCQYSGLVEIILVKGFFICCANNYC